MACNKCDVCGESCIHWRYFCGVCDVHIHVGCLAGTGNQQTSGFGEFLESFKAATEVVTGVLDLANYIVDFLNALSG